MPIDIPHKLQIEIDRYVSSGRYPDVEHVLIDALAALGRSEAGMTDEFEEELRISIREMESGNTRPVSEFFAELDNDHGWKTDRDA